MPLPSMPRWTMNSDDTRPIRKQCGKCTAPPFGDGVTRTCDQVVGMHAFCHRCKFAVSAHKPSARRRREDDAVLLSDVPRPVLTVIDGGENYDDGIWVADGEQPW